MSIYLKLKKKCFSLINESNLSIVDSCNYFAEDMDEQTASEKQDYKFGRLVLQTTEYMKKYTRY
jgi:hypothetical protein